MRRLSALAALVLAVGVLAPGVAADAQPTRPPSRTAVPDPGTLPRPPQTHGAAPPYLPGAVRPVPMPHARPHGPKPVPIPLARPQGPKPVPMPHAGEPAVPELRVPAP